MANTGKKVSVHYRGTFDNGEEFDSSYSRNAPIEFVCMAGQMIPGFDKAVEDMAVGDTKNVHIPAAEAYGERNEELVQHVPLASIPNASELPVGQTIYMRSPEGMPFPVKVLEVTDTEAVFDMNHEMAGKDLNFEITLVSVED